jgi:hypothetical protein
MSENLFVDYLKTGEAELFDKLEKTTRERVLNTVYRVLPCQESTAFSPQARTKGVFPRRLR